MSGSMLSQMKLCDMWSELKCEMKTKNHFSYTQPLIAGKTRLNELF